MSDKHCWTMIHCPLHSKCQLPLNPETNGLYQPEHVGEYCHNFMQVKTNPALRWGMPADELGEAE